MRRSSAICLPVLLGCGLIAGCTGDDSAREAVYPVTGKITHHGAPLDDAMVSFAPKSGQRTAVGRTNANGEFTLTTYEPGDGAMAGEYAVVVTKVVADAPQAPAGDGHSDDPYVNVGEQHGAGQAKAGSGVVMIQPKYGNANETPLTATVTADGENKFEFQVE